MNNNFGTFLSSVNADGRQPRTGDDVRIEEGAKKLLRELLGAHKLPYDAVFKMFNFSEDDAKSIIKLLSESDMIDIIGDDKDKQIRITEYAMQAMKFFKLG
jgi:hypothetical protein